MGWTIKQKYYEKESSWLSTFGKPDHIGNLGDASFVRVVIIIIVIMTMMIIVATAATGKQYNHITCFRSEFWEIPPKLFFMH